MASRERKNCTVGMLSALIHGLQYNHDTCIRDVLLPLWWDWCEKVTEYARLFFFRTAPTRPSLTQDEPKAVHMKACELRYNMR